MVPRCAFVVVVRRLDPLIVASGLAPLVPLLSPVVVVTILVPVLSPLLNVLGVASVDRLFGLPLSLLLGPPIFSLVVVSVRVLCLHSLVVFNALFGLDVAVPAFFVEVNLELDLPHVGVLRAVLLLVALLPGQLLAGGAFGFPEFRRNEALFGHLRKRRFVQFEGVLRGLVA